MSDIRKGVATSYPSADALTGAETLVVMQNGHARKVLVTDIWQALVGGSKQDSDLSSYTASTFIDSVINNRPERRIYVTYAISSKKLSDLPVTEAGEYIVLNTAQNCLIFLGYSGHVYYFIGSTWYQVK